MFRKLMYAYPSSEYATQFGFPNTGCYIICRADDDNFEHGPFDAYPTREEAEAAFRKIDLPDSPYSLRLYSLTGK